MSRARTQPPEPAQVRPFQVPDVTSLETSEGLRIRAATGSRVPLVSVVLAVDSTEGALPAERSGHAALTAAALQGGTGARSGAELAEALEGIGATLSVSAAWDATRASLRVLADHLEEALDLFAEVMRSPSFPIDEVGRVRNQRLAAIEQELAQPSSLADRSAARFFYRDGCPYARPRGGIRESVESFDPEAARAQFTDRFGPEIGVSVAGDVDPVEFRDLMDARFQGWGSGRERTPPPATEPRTRERRVYVVSRPGAVQSEIRVGHPGVERSHPDYFPLRVFNATLGGTFTSRLNLNLRERHGFTYGVRSRFNFRRGRGPFVISTAVETAVTAAAVRETMLELEGLVAEGPTPDEVDSVRDYMAGVFPIQMETTHQVAGQLSSLLVYDLPDDYLARYRENVRGVTADAAAEAGRSHVHPDQVSVVVVGDPEKVVPELESLGLGGVSVEEPA